MTKHTRWLIAAVVIVAAGCGKKSAPAPVAPPPAPTQAAAQPDGAAAERAAREDAAAKAAEERAAAQKEAARLRSVLEERIFFDYDDAGLRTEARQALDAKARELRDHPEVTLRIEGHADERGSTEYNLALGSRRAQTVAQYLSGYGVAGGRLETVSYGEERPLERGSAEASWSKNRRAEFGVTRGVATTEAAR